MSSSIELLVMSVTRLGSGVCVACVDEENRWVRPTRENANGWRQLFVDDLEDESGRIVVQVGHIVRWTLRRRAPKGTHTEDALVAPAKPELLARLSHADLLERCATLRERSLSSFRRNPGRSLMLFRPQELTGVRFSPHGKGGVDARIRFRHGTLQEDFAVKDLAWRALGRNLLRGYRKPELSWTPVELRKRATVSIRYVIVGKGQQEFRGRLWEFAVGIICDRPIPAKIDYSRL